MIVFVKRECPRHRGCFTMSDRCDHCIVEDFERRMREIFDRHAAAVGRIVAGVLA